MTTKTRGKDPHDPLHDQNTQGRSREEPMRHSCAVAQPAGIGSALHWACFLLLPISFGPPSQKKKREKTKKRKKKKKERERETRKANERAARARRPRRAPQQQLQLQPWCTGPVVCGSHWRAPRGPSCTALRIVPTRQSPQPTYLVLPESPRQLRPWAAQRERRRGIKRLVVLRLVQQSALPKTFLGFLLINNLLSKKRGRVKIETKNFSVAFLRRPLLRRAEPAVACMGRTGLDAQRCSHLAVALPRCTVADRAGNEDNEDFILRKSRLQAACQTTCQTGSLRVQICAWWACLRRARLPPAAPARVLARHQGPPIPGECSAAAARARSAPTGAAEHAVSLWSSRVPFCGEKPMFPPHRGTDAIAQRPWPEACRSVDFLSLRCLQPRC